MMKLPNFFVVITLPVLYICVQAQTSDQVFDNKTRSKKSEAQPRAQIVDKSIDALLSLADKIEQYIDRPINRAIVRLIELLKKPKDIAFQFIESFENTLKEKINTFIQRIITPKEEAKSFGVDISRCIGNSTEQLSSLPVYVLRLATKCVMNNVQEVEDLIIGAIIKVNESMVKAKNLFREVENCKDNFIIKQGFCLGVITAKVNLAIVKIPINVGDATVKFSNNFLSTTLISSLGFCTIGQVANLAEQAATIVADVVYCVSTKFPFISPLFRKLDDTDSCEPEDSDSSCNNLIILKVFLIWGVLFVCNLF